MPRPYSRDMREGVIGGGWNGFVCAQRRRCPAPSRNPLHPLDGLMLNAAATKRKNLTSLNTRDRSLTRVRRIKFHHPCWPTCPASMLIYK